MTKIIGSGSASGSTPKCHGSGTLTGTEAHKVPRGEEMLAYGVTALLLEPVLNELVEQAGLPRTRRPDHQELEQVVVRVVHFLHSEIQTLG
jgi:hypothetical protein